ncbi:hypothetical protein JHK87_024596 [Glycine soja]|nr:hypothetical protein JHK87_024596 [Glycine soja]
MKVGLQPKKRPVLKEKCLPPPITLPGYTWVDAECNNETRILSGYSLYNSVRCHSSPGVCIYEPRGDEHGPLLHVAHSSSDLIKERNGGSVGTIMREGDEGEDDGRGVPHQLLEASRKMLSSPRLPDEVDPVGAALGILHLYISSPSSELAYGRKRLSSVERGCPMSREPV